MSLQAGFDAAKEGRYQEARFWSFVVGGFSIILGIALMALFSGV